MFVWHTCHIEAIATKSNGNFVVETAEILAGTHECLLKSWNETWIMWLLAILTAWILGFFPYYEQLGLPQTMAGNQLARCNRTAVRYYLDG